MTDTWLNDCFNEHLFGWLKMTALIKQQIYPTEELSYLLNGLFNVMTDWMTDLPDWMFDV
jgi:hypothetical protein